MYFQTFKQITKLLGQMDTWFDKANDYAKSRSFDPNVFVGLRLAPDQFPLSRQVQIACDTVKRGAFRMAGKEVPVQEDTEKTVDELRARIKSVISYLDTFTEKDFEGITSRTVPYPSPAPQWKGKTMTAHDYFMEHVIPNFFFHTCHVYAILRHNGVPLGKHDYLGSITHR
ncbi:MAG: DUF1993 domain-containing protein [Polyangiaceae bacterium]|nr:DUF1993 domain-containing protein [Polyangiaceae bacterium]